MKLFYIFFSIIFFLLLSTNQKKQKNMNKKISYWIAPALSIQDFDAVKDAISSVFKVDKSLLTSKSRKREIVEARMVIAYILLGKLFEKSREKWNTITVGNRINKDHSTIVYYQKRIKELRDVDPWFNAKIVNAESEIKNKLLWQKKG
jgi:chromosomal replication initiation ATPase DnaA